MTNHPVDKKIITALGGRRLDAGSLSAKTSIGKTTIQYRLLKMVEAGLIHRSIISERKVFYSVNKKAVNEARDSKVLEAFSGIHATQAYKDFLETPRQTSIYSVQGTEAIESLVRTLPSQFIESAHGKQKRRNTLIKGFVSEDIRTRIKSWPRNIIESHVGRTVGLKMVPGNILNGACEILCTDDTVMFHNTNKKRVVVIKDKEISHFIYGILEFLYERIQIPVFPLNEYLKKID